MEIIYEILNTCFYKNKQSQKFIKIQTLFIKPLVLSSILNDYLLQILEEGL